MLQPCARALRAFANSPSHTAISASIDSRPPLIEMGSAFTDWHDDSACSARGRRFWRRPAMHFDRAGQSVSRDFCTGNFRRQ